MRKSNQCRSWRYEPVCFRGRVGGGLKAGGEERMRGQGEMEKGSTAELGWLRLFVVVLGGPGMVGAEAGGDAECCDEKEEGRRAKSAAGEWLLHTRRSKASRSFFSVMSSHGGGAQGCGGAEKSKRVRPRWRRRLSDPSRPRISEGGSGRSEEAPDARDLDWRNAGQAGAPRSVGCVCLEARERL